MARVGFFFVLLTTALIFGCTTVSSVEPVGERPKEISRDEWDGTWIHKNRSVTIKVLDAPKGLLQLAWVEEKEGNLKLESYQIFIRESGEWIFGNVREKGGAAPYYWALIKKDMGQIIVWTPDPAYFKKLVQEGKLPGKVEKYEVLLEKLRPEQLKVILSADKAVCFEWQNPVVFFRLGK